MMWSSHWTISKNLPLRNIAGLMADVAMPSIAAGRDTNFLAEATSKAIEVLSKNPKGFILMVEGSQIDCAGHDNNLEGIISETAGYGQGCKGGL